MTSLRYVTEYASRSTKLHSRQRAEPEADVRAVLGSSLERRWQKFAGEVARNARRCTEPSIHDLRVATRRLIATLDILCAVLGDDEIRKLRRDLRRLLKNFNDLRDVHIQILALRGIRRRFPVLQPFQAYLTAQERRLVGEAGKQIRRIPVKDLGDSIGKIHTHFETVLSHPGMMSAAEVAIVGIAGMAFSRATRLRWQVTPSDPRTIHKLRVAFKKLRYTLEVVDPFLPWMGKPVFRLMGFYQTTLGEVQDAQVLLRSVQEFSRSGGSSAHMALLPVVQHLIQSRTQKIEAFMQQADTIKSFWLEGARAAGVERPGRRGSSVRRLGK